LVRRQSDALKNKKPAVGTSAERGHRAETPEYASIYIFRAICLRDCKGAALVTPRYGNEAMKLHLAEIVTQIAPALLFKAALEAIDFKVTGLPGRVRGADVMNPPLQRQERTLDEGTPHTLRHNFASLAADMGLADHTIAGLLGHVRHSITSRYMHLADKALIEAVDLVANETLRLMRG
jgi:integrase